MIVANGETRYRDVRCDDCGNEIPPEHPSLVDEHGWRYLQTRDGLHIKLSGGYGEFIDLMTEAQAEDCHLLVCSTCAQRLCDRHPFIREVVARHLDLNVGHVCDGELVWVPMPECEVDADRHGWREVFVVARDGDWDDVVAVRDTEAEAERVAAAGEALVVRRELIANLGRRIGDERLAAVRAGPRPEAGPVLRAGRGRRSS